MRCPGISYIWFTACPIQRCCIFLGVLDLLGCLWFAWVLVAWSIFNFNFFIETFKLNLQGLLPAKENTKVIKLYTGPLNCPPTRWSLDLSKTSQMNTRTATNTCLQDPKAGRRSGEHAYSNKHLPTRPESRSPVRWARIIQWIKYKERPLSVIDTNFSPNEPQGDVLYTWPQLVTCRELYNYWI